MHSASLCSQVSTKQQGTNALSSVSIGQIVSDVVVAYFCLAGSRNGFTSCPRSQVLFHSRPWLDASFRPLNFQTVRWLRSEAVFCFHVSLWTRDAYNQQQYLHKELAFSVACSTTQRHNMLMYPI